MKAFAVALSCFLCARYCLADLRQASQPRRGYKVKNQSRRRQIKYEAQFAIYMEPSDFEYEGLIKQRDGGGYDNFLRSNIDNQQDRRNFNTEDGRDHLPFRSFESAATDASTTIKNKIPTDFPGTNISVAPGQPTLVPLRWNNPHSAELEVNIWIMRQAPAKPVVVPILKPTCSGEGYQDQAFTFTVPNDFNSLGTKVPGFKGCKQVGDCVLQIYAHSVESRQYSQGVPLTVSGTVTPAQSTVANENAIKKLTHISMQDPGLDLSTLRTLCLPRNDPSARITTSNPQEARLISDVYNHAYQNSDYSPYSGQQPKEISKNLQASCVIKMIPGNRGELGQRALLTDNKAGFKFQRSLDRKAKQLVKQYEKIANSIINMIEGKHRNNDTMTATNHEQQQVTQRSEFCFRCKEVGATTTRRLETNTYIPSFQIEDASLLAAVNVLKTPEYDKVLSETGLVQIYVPVMQDLMEEFEKAYALNITYQGPMLKDTLTTMADTTKFKKIDAQGQEDKGLYAAREAYKKHGYAPWGTRTPMPLPSAAGLNSAMSTMMATECNYGSTCAMPIVATGVGGIAEELDMHGIMADANCDNIPETGNTDEMECKPPSTKLFDEPYDVEAESLGISQGVVASDAYGTHSFLTAALCLLSLCGLFRLQ